MSMVKKSITVTDSQDAFIQAQIASGHYASDSEVIREALREKELRIAEIDALRAKLVASEAMVSLGTHLVRPVGKIMCASPSAGTTFTRSLTR